MAKKRAKKSGTYFDKEQEDAVVKIIQTTDETVRNEIFKKYLYQPLHKMAEIIINRYNLYSRDLEFNDLLNECLSHLYIQIPRFDPTKGKKAYSYFGTIIRHHAIAIRIKETTKLNRSHDFEDFQQKSSDDLKYSYKIDDGESFTTLFFRDLCKKIESMLNMSVIDKDTCAVGNSLLYIMRNWEEVLGTNFDNFKEKYIRKWILANTDITEVGLRKGLKFFRGIYSIEKQSTIDEKKYE